VVHSAAGQLARCPMGAQSRPWWRAHCRGWSRVFTCASPRCDAAPRLVEMPSPDCSHDVLQAGLKVPRSHASGVRGIPHSALQRCIVGAEEDGGQQGGFLGGAGGEDLAHHGEGPPRVVPPEAAVEHISLAGHRGWLGELGGLVDEMCHDSSDVQLLSVCVPLC
jgi:hypothetical protein